MLIVWVRVIHFSCEWLSFDEWARAEVGTPVHSGENLFSCLKGTCTEFIERQ